VAKASEKVEVIRIGRFPALDKHHYTFWCWLAVEPSQSNLILLRIQLTDPSAKRDFHAESAA
tara:strand:- start:191 stop:376 length:186 start_codon:yes stop_codon:yes gene_type:complete